MLRFLTIGSSRRLGYREVTAVKKCKRLLLIFFFYTKKIFRDVPSPTVAGFQFVMDQAAAYNAKVRAYSPKDFTDNSFLDDLVKSGFLARLKRVPS